MAVSQLVYARANGLVRRPTHHFPSRLDVMRPKKRRKDTEMVGWTLCEIAGPSVSRDAGLATASGYRPTHPTTPNQSAIFVSEKNTTKIIQPNVQKFRRARLVFLHGGARPDSVGSAVFHGGAWRFHASEKKTKRHGKWWVGLCTRLPGHLFQEALAWRRHPGIDPPTLRPRTGFGFCIDQASARRGREASGYAFPREAWERDGEERKEN